MDQIFGIGRYQKLTKTYKIGGSTMGSSHPNEPSKLQTF